MCRKLYTKEFGRVRVRLVLRVVEQAGVCLFQPAANIITRSRHCNLTKLKAQ